MDIARPRNGLFFMLNGVLHLLGDSVLISDIVPQPDNRSDPETTLVCVTTSVNTAYCRSQDNNGLTNDTAGAVGKWYYPNCTHVPRSRNDIVKLERIGYTNQIRLAREVPDFTPPLGVYTCAVPEPSTGVIHRALIIIKEEGIGIEKSTSY